MENSEAISKKEFTTFLEKFDEFKLEMSDFRKEMKADMIDFKTEMKTEMSDFKTEMRTEMSDFKTGMITEMSNFKNEVSSEIRDRFFVLEEEYGTKINAIYDVVVLNKEISDKKFEDLEKRISTNEMRIIQNALEIDSLKKSKKLKSKA